MRIPNQIGYVLSGTATLALLAGCGGGGGSTPSAGSAFVPTQSVGAARPMSIGHSLVQGHSVLRPGMPLRVGQGIQGPGFVLDEAGAAGDVFVSDAANNVVDIFSSAGKSVGQLTGFSEPQGLATDSASALYVADTANSRIQVYAKGYKGKPKTLSDPGQYPAGVAVSSAGEVAVTNIISTSGGAGSVSFYSKGKTSPSKTVSNSDLARVYFDAFDKAGNLFVDGSNSNGSFVIGELVGGAKASSIKILSVGNSIEFPGGLQVNKSDELVLDDQEAFNAYTYKVLKGSSFGSPIKTTALSGSSDPVTIALTSTNADIRTADAGNEASYEFKYPAGGSPVQTISLSGAEPIGVAVTPEAKP